MSAPRSAPAQPDPGDLGTSPSWAADGIWYRAHREQGASDDGGAWWFATVGADDDPEARGRFDLLEPDGTCYLASTPEAAARERTAFPGRLIPEALVLGASVSAVRLAPTRRTADLLHPDAALFGVTGELSAAGPYVRSQAWAARLRADAFDGVRYQPRFSTDRAEALAVFGPAGVPASAQRVDHTTMRAVLERAGHTVVAPPRDADLDWV